MIQKQSIILRTVVGVTLLLFPFSVFGQTGDVKTSISAHEAKIGDIRKEISENEKKIKRYSNQEYSQLEVLNALNKKISLIEQLLTKLKSEIVRLEKSIAFNAVQLEKKQEELDRLRKIVSERLVQIYKLRQETPLELILTSTSLNMAYTRFKYLRLIGQHDKKDLENLKTKIMEVKFRQDLLNKELAEQKQYAAEKEEEEARVIGDRKSKQNILKEIRNNKKLLKEVVDQKKQDIEELEKIITFLEQKRKEELAKAEKEVKSTVKIPKHSFELKSHFSKYKGNLPWPSSGKIVARFGPQKHPVLKTITRNPGVDIDAAYGSPVYCVANGKVTFITWMRRYGNVIIVDHQNGYYTVYGYLSEISVNVDQNLTAGTPIGKVGESTTDGRSLLHFEIYSDKQAVDPELFLKKFPG